MSKRGTPLWACVHKEIAIKKRIKHIRRQNPKDERNQIKVS